MAWWNFWRKKRDPHAFSLQALAVYVDPTVRARSVRAVGRLARVLSVIEKMAKRGEYSAERKLLNEEARRLRGALAAAGLPNPENSAEAFALLGRMQNANDA